MGKAKSSRKGKKACRADIPTDDIDDFEKSTRDALRSGSKSYATVDSNSLMIMDKPSEILDRLLMSKIEKHREKVLHSDNVLKRNSLIEPVPSSMLKKCKKKKKAPPKASTDTQDNPKALTNMPHDIWDAEGENNAKTKLKSAASLIPAVEVEPPGCSFNPSFEDHQDTLAQAVALEMQKRYRNELGPKPVPLTVPGQIIDEEEVYFLDADNDDDMVDEDLNGDNDINHGQRPSKAKRVTRVELNRRERRKERLKAEAEAKKIENISKEIDCLPEIAREIAEEDEEKEKRHVRRIVARQERLKTAPPRLGKHKFVPAPLQVLLSEEISGSLRKLKGCPTLARDRYKSLEKRGLLAPKAKLHKKR